MTPDRLLRKGDYVHGSFLKPEAVDGYINGVNPGDRADVLGRFPFSESSVDEAVDFAAIGARAWRRVPLNDRALAVRRFRDHWRAGHRTTHHPGVWQADLGEPPGGPRGHPLLDLFLDEGLSSRR